MVEETKTYRYNESRAKGVDKKGHPQKFQLSGRTVHNPNTTAYVQVLGTGMDTHDTLPSILLFFDKQRFIFNAGEGLQRFCAEHKIKLSKIDHICLSRVCSETAGGLPGLLLTLAGMGNGLSVNIWGPPSLELLINAMKSFIPHGSVVNAKEIGLTTCSSSAALLDTSNSAEPFVVVENELVKISAILLLPSSLEGAGKKPSDISVIYVCELHEILGKFDKEKADALGLKERKKYGLLQKGECVKSDCLDIMVHPSDVMDPPIPGPVVFIVDCPTNSHAKELLSIQTLNGYYPDFVGNSPKSSKAVNCIIHLTPPPVINSPNYEKWMKKFPTVQHIMAGHSMKHVEIPILKSSTRMAARLNYLCPQFFPVPAVGSFQQHNDAAQGSITSSEVLISQLCESTSAENLMKFTLRPHNHLGLDKSNVPSLMAPSEVIDELLSENPEIVDAAQLVSQFWSEPGEMEDTSITDDTTISEKPLLDGNTVPSFLQNIRRDDLEIVLLGTGSSQPSKYRNVSSIYINLFSKGSLLLDCGEGTLAQLKRRYGMEGAENAVRNLRCIWISHIHADHHAGIARILALRRDLLKGVPHERLLVIGPMQLELFLDAYQRLEDLDMQFLDCRSTMDTSWNALECDAESKSNQFFAGSSTNSEDLNDKNKNHMGSTLFAGESCLQGCSKRMKLSMPVENDSLLRSLRNVLWGAGLEGLISFPVVHCPEAFGVVLKAAERTNAVGEIIQGWKIVYSGDTRPCSEVIEASHGATVLIHEATFEDCMVDEAVEKNHSTTKEAIEVGDSAGAYRVILTHFSQRYPKIPALDEISMKKTCIAFDLMSVNIADLPMLPKILPYLKLLFRTDIAS
ncbi:tRNAse Z TRZ4, mitochondrial isoform X4 [Manihot esculenta]|nr:tRNAse Z TRZ4, mitochondrial isoform X4 [Manihot esculenta]XP_021620710.1 tRNAse Z TRZ4, mitochondrial isoform X4 [Manihot esculenta]XP_021620711.1 tRNAse Z TRZ4, mitochondrial isoform X4 [Manihot esculenta]XP_021620712.1 tRNAse Z TRZ4, mitochondrial isoform X4 [Manihot esculenta]